MSKTNNYVLQDMKGRVGKLLVFKTNKAGKTYATKYPDRSQVKFTKDQTKNRKRFAEAVKFAREVMKDPVRAAAYQVPRHKALYHTLIKVFLAGTRNRSSTPKASVYTDQYLATLTLNDRQFKAIKHFRKKGILSNGAYRKLTAVSKPTATRDLQELVKMNILVPNGVRGAGSSYELMGSRPA